MVWIRSLDWLLVGERLHVTRLRTLVKDDDENNNNHNISSTNSINNNNGNTIATAKRVKSIVGDILPVLAYFEYPVIHVS